MSFDRDSILPPTEFPPAFSPQIARAKAKLRNSYSATPRVTTMPTTRTAADHDAVKNEFLVCYDTLSDQKNTVWTAEAGRDRKAAMENMLATMVRFSRIHYFAFA